MSKFRVYLLNNKQRGRLVTKGVLRTAKDSVTAQALGIPLIIIGLIIIWAFFINNLDFELLSVRILVVMSLFLVTIVFLSIIYITGLETDAIYELGASNRDTSLLDKILGRTFQPFKSIVAIKYGKTDWFNQGRVYFIALIDRNKGQILRPYLDIDYKNNFFNDLLRYIKKKCPNAKWILVKYENLDKR